MAGNNPIGEGRGALFIMWKQRKGERLNSLLTVFHSITRVKGEPPSPMHRDRRFGIKCAKLIVIVESKLSTDWTWKLCMLPPEKQQHCSYIHD